MIVRGMVRRTGTGEIDWEYLTVPLYEKGKLGAWCLAVPYLRQGDYPVAGSYAEGVNAMYRFLYEQVSEFDLPVIAMGHLQAIGSEISENDRSERTIIGGLECVSPDAFDRKLHIRHWGIYIGDKKSPDVKMYVIPFTYSNVSLLRETTNRGWCWSI